MIPVRSRAGAGPWLVEVCSEMCDDKAAGTKTNECARGRNPNALPAAKSEESERR